MARRVSAAILLAASLAIPAAPGTAGPPDDDPPREAIRITKVHPPIGDVAEILQIRQECGTFELSFEPESIALLVEVYEDGKKVDGQGIADTRFGCNPEARKGSYSIQIADLDQLPLGGGKPNHFRVHATIITEGDHSSATGRASCDLSKDVFDPKAGGLVTLIGPTGGRWVPAAEVPLFFMPRGMDRFRHNDADPIKKVAERNPKGRFLVAYLRIKPAPARP